MKKNKILTLIQNILNLIAIVFLLVYLIIDMQTYHAPRVFYIVGIIFLLLGSIFSLINYFRNRHSESVM